MIVYSCDSWPWYVSLLLLNNCSNIKIDFSNLFSVLKISKSNSANQLSSFIFCPAVPVETEKRLTFHKKCLSMRLRELTRRIWKTGRSSSRISIKRSRRSLLFASGYLCLSSCHLQSPGYPVSFFFYPSTLDPNHTWLLFMLDINKKKEKGK